MMTGTDHIDIMIAIDRIDMMITTVTIETTRVKVDHVIVRNLDEISVRHHKGLHPTNIRGNNFTIGRNNIEGIHPDPHPIVLGVALRGDVTTLKGKILLVDIVHLEVVPHTQKATVMDTVHPVDIPHIPIGIVTDKDLPQMTDIGRIVVLITIKSL